MCAVCDGVDEGETAFGVCAVYFNGFGAEGMQDVAGPICAAIGHVFCGGNHANDAVGQVEFCHGSHCANDGCGATHVKFHVPHAVATFEGYAARVKGYAFADEDDGRGIGIGARVFEDDKTRRSSTPLSHGAEGTHAFI